ncbi:tetrahydroberberine oxidase-like [Aristolochia californica]|uniref:tetrahydroberberine oxidase-like n=1 Tax=Aristolochia californica TaxID=171875 RepID=UPI0035D72484
MVSSTGSTSLTVLSVFLVLFASVTTHPVHETFLQCLTQKLPSSQGSSQVIYTPNTIAYTQLLQSSINNLRFNSSSTSKPLLIISPTHESQIQATVVCCRKHGIEMRVRSGGHDYEGLSFVSDEPFVVVDMANFRAVTVDVEDNTAWVQTGATLGDLYYGISQKSGIHAFPGGLCPTVGIGGLIAGGGIGTMMRKFGLAADNVIDARLVDANGRILDRKSMGEDLFWAIRGGGGASFGVILTWKIRLVPVPPTVTVFNINRTLEEGATRIVNRWQYLPEKCHENLFIRVLLQGANVGGNRTVRAIFDSLFLGPADELLKVTGECFPDLGLNEKDCREMSWIDSIIFIAGYPSGSPKEALLSREPPPATAKGSFKAKSDFVKKPISESSLKMLLKLFHEENSGAMLWEPLGGKMSKISEHEIPFPHRKGNWYNVQYVIRLQDPESTKKGLDWINRLYDQMTPHVSKHPRTAYLNYRDLDLGVNGKGKPSYIKSSSWGFKYFKGNFRRLALVKGHVDKQNFFRNEQSIPPL